MPDLVEKENNTALDAELDNGSNPLLLAAGSIIAGLLLSGIVLPFILPRIDYFCFGTRPESVLVSLKGFCSDLVSVLVGIHGFGIASIEPDSKNMAGRIYCE